MKTLKFITTHPLNKHRKIDAVLRFLKWQLASRLIDGDVAFQWINQARLFARLGETGITGNIYCGLHEFPEMAFVLHTTKSADLFIDVGANAGSYTILACAVKGASGISFEPIPNAYQRLLQNIRLNDLSDRVSALNIGVSDREGELLFTTSEDTTNHVIRPGEPMHNVLKVQVSTLDTVLQGRCPTILKVDVEGFESLVIKGAQGTLSNPLLHSVIMELNGSGQRYGFKDDDIRIAMHRYGFLPYEYEPFSKRLQSLNRNTGSSGNCLFIRNEHEVRELIAQAPSVIVNGSKI